MNTRKVSVPTTDTRPEIAPSSQTPRNLDVLARQADADGWATSIEHGTGWVELLLVARVITSDLATAEAKFRCLWRTNSAGRFRWAGASLYRDGVEEASGIGWRELLGLVARGTMSMVDPDAEADDRTCLGRSARRWRALAEEYAQAAAEAFERGRSVRAELARLTAQRRGMAPGQDAEWAERAAEATAVAFRLLDRRSTLAHRTARRAARDIASAVEDGRQPGARRGHELAMRVRRLAQACAGHADAIEGGALDAEATAVCDPYVAAIAAAAEREEAEWRAAHPTGDVRAFANDVIQTINNADAEFAAWWHTHARPGMSYHQGWDAWQAERGHSTGTEVTASLRLRDDTDHALCVLGIDAAPILRQRAIDANDAVLLLRTDQLAEFAARGVAAAEPGPHHRPRDAHSYAQSVWSLLCGTDWGGMSLDMAKNLAELERWRMVCPAAEDVRRLLLIRHGLDVRDRAHAQVRQQIEEEQEERGRIGRAAYDVAYAAAIAAGEPHEDAEEAAVDARVRTVADAQGCAPDGREAYHRGDAVWVAPNPDSKDRPYVATIASYTPAGVFLLRDACNRLERAHAERLSPAGPEEAAADRVRQEQQHAQEEAERQRRQDEAHARAVEAERQRKAREERLTAREQAARIVEPPTTPGGVWRPVHAVPASVGRLWQAAARNGWRLARHTLGDERASGIEVRITGTTDRGIWDFRLLWVTVRGRYRVQSAQSRARWADGRTGPRGGEIHPTIADVLYVMNSETHEGAAAPLGALVGIDEGD